MEGLTPAERKALQQSSISGALPDELIIGASNNSKGY
jgi:hypothetical protein